MGEGPSKSEHSEASQNIQSGKIKEQRVLLFLSKIAHGDQRVLCLISGLKYQRIAEVRPPSLGCSPALKWGSSSQFNPRGGQTYPQSFCFWPYKRGTNIGPSSDKNTFTSRLRFPGCVGSIEIFEEIKGRINCCIICLLDDFIFSSEGRKMASSEP